MSYLPEILLVLFILNLGTAFGAGLYEARIIIPQWFPKSTASSYGINQKAIHETDTGRRFWALVTTIPLTLLTLANLIVAWQSSPPEHDWWLAAGLVALLERVGTFSFFIPTIIKLQQADQRLSPALSRLAGLWVGSNNFRNVLTLVAWLFALRAFSLFD